MKKANEYIKNWSFYDKIPTKELEAIIKLAQEDAIRETVKECAESAKLYFVDLEQTEVEIDGQSILSVADKLIKKL